MYMDHCLENGFLFRSVGAKKWRLFVTLVVLVCCACLLVGEAQARRNTAVARIIYALEVPPSGSYDTPQAALSAVKKWESDNGIAGAWTYSNLRPCEGDSSLWWGQSGNWCHDYWNNWQNYGGVTSYMYAWPICPVGWALDQGYIGGQGSRDDPRRYEPVCFIDVPDQQCPEGSCHGQGTNPVYPEDSTYRQADIDYVDPRGTLSYERYYNSSLQSMQPLQGSAVLPPSPPSGITQSYDRQPGPGFVSGAPYGAFRYINNARQAGNVVQVMRRGGLFYDYNWNGTTASAISPSTRDTLRFSPPSTSGGTPSWAASGQWIVRRGLTDETERYDADGVLRQIQYRNGQTKTLTYSDSGTPSSVAPGPGYLIAVTDTFGKSINLIYDSFGRLATLVDPMGQTVTYSYELVRSDWSCTTPGCFRTKTVTYQDGQTKTYHWDEVDYTSDAGATSSQYNLLTGITDENGQRYSTIRYDSKGQAISTELVGGVLRYSFSNVQPRTSVTVTDPLGTARTFNFVNAAGLTQLASLTGAPCDGCGPASATYDSNGNVASQTDFNGNVTCYAYDLNRNLETARVEGLPAGTACPSSLDGYTVPTGARKISTQWHPVWRQPAKVAEPKQVTTYVFNGDGSQYCAPASAKVEDTPIGVVCSQSVQATTDANGSQGFGANGTGGAKTTQWKYDGDGQVLSVKGPRTDINDRVSFGYRAADDTATSPQYRRGDLYQITDALGHATTIDRMDKNGRPLQMTDANGLVTTFTYAQRGWLTSQTVTPAGGAGQTTSYEYDKVGQLIKVTQPDGGTVSFSYDDAHRLIGATDSSGNSICYTLDAMGNRTQEQSKDPNGNLARQITRVFDSMNRPLKVTVGAAQ